MKSTLIIISLAFALVCKGQEFSDETTFMVNTQGLESFRLYNLNGNVKVTGVDGNSATLKLNRTLRSASSVRLEKAKTTLRFDSLILNNTIYFFMESPDRVFKIDPEGNGHYESDWDRSKNERFEVKYNFDITLSVPKGLDIYVSNHRSNLQIENIEGYLYAKNHHSDLLAKDIGGNAKLKNHHGDITVSFTRNPSEDCEFYTHHGDVRIKYPGDLSADVYLKSRHGEFFTAFNWSPIPTPVIEKASDRGTKYIVNDRVSVRIGKGGPKLNVRTWHGDIYITQN